MPQNCNSYVWKIYFIYMKLCLTQGTNIYFNEVILTGNSWMGVELLETNSIESESNLFLLLQWASSGIKGIRQLFKGIFLNLPIPVQWTGSLSISVTEIIYRVIKRHSTKIDEIVCIIQIEVVQIFCYQKYNFLLNLDIKQDI